MQTLILLLLMVATLVASVRLYGWASFATLGVFGAAIYNIPAVIDHQLPFYLLAHSRRTYVSTAADVDLVVLVAWAALLVGVLVGSLFARHGAESRRPVFERHMESLAIASAVLATAGIFYLQIVSENLLFFFESRFDQSVDSVSIIWKWTALTGLIASSLTGSRKLLLYHLLVLFIIFLRGDRTMIAIAAASLIVAAAYRDPRWYAVFTPLRAIAAAAAVIGILFGKPLYLTLKSGLAGEGWSVVSLPLKEQFLYHFEPIVTFSHLSYVMRKNIQIGSAEFGESILANLFIVPSWFGFSTNVYNEVVTQTLPSAIRFGVAGNYLAHGWTVGGILGAAAFYFILALVLRLCDVQFRQRYGAPKLFWCCVGGVVAFYIHRNGMDNILSFVRQVAIACVLLAIVAAAIRATSRVAAPARMPAEGQAS